MSEISNVVEPVGSSQKDATTKKTAACAVNLGEAIIREMTGVTISGQPSENLNELMAAVINTELNR